MGFFPIKIKPEMDYDEWCPHTGGMNSCGAQMPIMPRWNCRWTEVRRSVIGYYIEDMTHPDADYTIVTKWQHLKGPFQRDLWPADGGLQHTYGPTPTYYRPVMPEKVVEIWRPEPDRGQYSHGTIYWFDNGHWMVLNGTIGLTAAELEAYWPRTHRDMGMSPISKEMIEEAQEEQDALVLAGREAIRSTVPGRIHKIVSNYSPTSYWFDHYNKEAYRPGYNEPGNPHPERHNQ
jgi:hypothetical protein